MMLKEEKSSPTLSTINPTRIGQISNRDLRGDRSVTSWDGIAKIYLWMLRKKRAKKKLLVKVKQSHYRPGQALGVAGV